MRNAALILAVILATSSLAAAAPIGDGYWLSIGPFATLGGHLQGAEDDASDAGDAVLGGGVGLTHVGGFSYHALFEGAYLPVSPGGTVRGEVGFGYGYLLLGGSVAQYYGGDSIVTAGPTVTVSLPIATGATTHVAGIFYRLDVPVAGPGPEYELRHQAGVRFLFDFPVLFKMFAAPQRSWWQIQL